MFHLPWTGSPVTRRRFKGNMSRYVVGRLKVLAVAAGVLFLVVIVAYREELNEQEIERLHNRKIPNRQTHPKLTPMEEKRIQKSSKTKCSLVPGVKCHSECCEDHKIFRRYFSNPLKCNGTFVEIGALDGITESNTMFFQQALGWRGLLVEGNPKFAKALKVNRPRTVIKNVAICHKGKKFVEFTKNEGRLGGDVVQMIRRGTHSRKVSNKTIAVPCMPTGDILREAGITSVDFFSLDVEGAEMITLETMDWTIPVKVFLVDLEGPRAWAQKISNYLVDNGFRRAKDDVTGVCTFNAVFENVELIKDV